MRIELRNSAINIVEEMIVIGRVLHRRESYK